MSGAREIAAVLTIYGGFALFQAPAARQPLSRFVARRGAWVPRVVGLSGAAIAMAMVAPNMGRGEAALFTFAASMGVATIFVPLAAVRPRVAWGLAVASPVLALALMLSGAG